MSSTRTLRARVTIKRELAVENNANTPKEKFPQKQKHVRRPAIKNENIKLEDFATDAKQIKLEVPVVNQNTSKSPKRNKILKKEIKKEKDVGDIESGGWEPDNWKEAVELAVETDANASKEKFPQKQKHVRRPAIKNENKLEDFATDDKQIKLEVPSVNQKTSKSPKRNKILKKEIKIEKEDVGDIESGGWKPDNWKEVYENILKMRKMYVAPVDSLGAEECPEKDVKPEVFRYQTLISVMLSSQTKDQVTFAATQRLIEHGLDVDNILKTSDEKIGELIYPAGFWKSKVKYIKNTSQILKDQYNGDIPRTFKELCKLPGVGPKMANIVMSVGWNDTVGIAVDTHVHRISNRLGWVPKTTKDPEQTRKALESWLPKELWKDGSLHLVGFGQTVCKPIKPNCKECLNNQLCPFGRSN